MRSERIGLRFSKKDEDIISWFLMLKENHIEKSFAVKALLKAFFLNENINGGSIRIRNDVFLEPTSISINEIALNDDIMKIKSNGIKLASFTKDIIRSFISIGEEDNPPQYIDLQKIHTKYKLKYLNSLIYNDSEKTDTSIDSVDLKLNNNELKIDTSNKYIRQIEEQTDLGEKLINDNEENEKKEIDNHNEFKKEKTKKRNPLLEQI